MLRIGADFFRFDAQIFLLYEKLELLLQVPHASIIRMSAIIHMFYLALLYFGQGNTGMGDTKDYEKMRVLRMGLPTVESFSGLQESIFRLFRCPQLNSRKKYKYCLNLIEFPLSF